MHEFLADILKRKPAHSRRNGNCAPAASFLQADENISGMLPNASRLIALQNDCLEILPEYFAACEVMKLEKERLVIGVPSQAAAARLRQKLPLLQARLENAGWQLREIRLKVRLKNRGNPVFQPEKKPLPEKALEELGKLEVFLADAGSHPALIDAVHAMMKRHGKNTG